MSDDVIFNEDPITTTSLGAKQGPFVKFLLRTGIVKTEGAAKAVLLVTGLVSFSLAVLIFVRTVNEEPINPNKHIPPSQVRQI